LFGPIFNREVLTIPRRGKHYVTRGVYLFVLWVLAFTAWQAAYGFGIPVSQGDLAFFGTLLFQLLSALQLTLVLFFSALFAASAVTQEKDRRTFVLLLMTDLRNYEIVLGKLLGSLLQIGTLILISVPVFAFIMLLGGVSFEQVLLTFLVMTCSAFAAGALGCLLALWRDKTFQTLALTVLALVLFFLVVEGLALVPVVVGWLGGESTAALETALAAWQTRLNPYRALPAVAQDESAPVALAFAGLALAAGVLLSGLGIWKLRKWNPGSEPAPQREPEEDRDLGSAQLRAEITGQAVERPAEQKVDIHAAPGKVREVWPNPILWREMRTRGYGRRPLLVKAAYLLVFVLIFLGVSSNLPASTAGPATRLVPATGLVPVFVLSLLLVNAQAVTAITSERDLKALDLLLVTDLTPREFVFGKLGGIFYNTKEIILPPLVMACAYAGWGFMEAEALVYLLIAMAVLFAFAAVLGLHVALHTVNTRLAVGYSLGTVFFLFIGTMICIYLILVTSRFYDQWAGFLLFLAIGIGGLLVVLGGRRPSVATGIASGLCPLAVFYAIVSILVGNPATGKAGDPLIPFVVITFAFGFTIAAMLVPLLSEFDVALDYTGPAEE
jgi:ABC-type transport system involved in multi-copper enzyme maturation permease subunit